MMKGSYAICHASMFGCNVPMHDHSDRDRPIVNDRLLLGVP
jgi:hypothetical protein